MNYLLKRSFSYIVDGKLLQKQILDGVKQNINFHMKQIKRSPNLGIILIGNDIPSLVYVNKKLQLCEKIGIECQFYHLDEQIQENDVIKLIKQMNQDTEIDSILIQLPIPKHLVLRNLLKSLNPIKDVDCLQPQNYSQFLMGLEKSKIMPCTAEATLFILDQYNLKVQGLNCVIIGCSELVGLPISLLLLNRQATITICHHHSRDLEKHLKSADLIISATGQQKIKAEWIQNNSIVIDIGYNWENGILSGDIEYELACKKTKLITPVPGGIGPITLAFLIKNVVKSWMINNNIKNDL